MLGKPDNTQCRGPLCRGKKRSVSETLKKSTRQSRVQAQTEVGQTTHQEGLEEDTHLNSTGLTPDTAHEDNECVRQTHSWGPCGNNNLLVTTAR